MKLDVEQNKKSYKKARVTLLKYDFFEDEAYLKILAVFVLLMVLNVLNNIEVIEFFPNIFSVATIVIGVILIGITIYVFTNILSQYNDIKKDSKQLYEGELELIISDKGIEIAPENRKNHLVYWYKLEAYQVLRNNIFIFPRQLNGPLIIVAQQDTEKEKFQDFLEFVQQKLKERKK